MNGITFNPSAPPPLPASQLPEFAREHEAITVPPEAMILLFPDQPEILPGSLHNNLRSACAPLFFAALSPPFGIQQPAGCAGCWRRLAPRIGRGRRRLGFLSGLVGGRERILPQRRDHRLLRSKQVGL